MVPLFRAAVSCIVCRLLKLEDGGLSLEALFSMPMCRLLGRG